MELQLFTPDPKSISIDPLEVMSLMGPTEEDLDRHAIQLAVSLIPECLDAAAPKGGFVWLEAGGTDGHPWIEVGKLRFMVGPMIALELAHAVSYVLFAVTAGPGPELLAREQLMRGNYLEGMLMDLIGSLIVESAAEQIQKKILDLAIAKGLKTTNRYSPGHCSWNVKEQQLLFRIIPAEKCGITLSESSLMSPVKSVSGIIGIGPAVTYRPNTCVLCPIKNCAFRKTGKGHI
jgi:hypothetical protein